MKRFLTLVSILITAFGFVLIWLSVLVPHKTELLLDFDTVSTLLEPIGLPYTELPLGATELLEDRSLNLLQLDAFLHRNYKFNGNSFNLFIAYWEPNKTTQRITAVHNPDVCWVERTGWQEFSRLESTYLSLILSDNHISDLAPSRENSLKSSISTFPISDLPSPNSHHLSPITSNPSPSHRLVGPVEYRLLETPGGSDRFHTYFWQVLEGKVTRIDRIGPGSYLHYLRTIPERIRAKRQPMWFVRIHSKVPLAPVVESTGSAEDEGRRAEPGEEGEGLIKTTPRSALRATSFPDAKYLVDYPEVRELLRSIHKLTTGEEEM